MISDLNRYCKRDQPFRMAIFSPGQVTVKVPGNCGSGVGLPGLSYDDREDSSGHCWGSTLVFPWKAGTWMAAFLTIGKRLTGKIPVAFMGSRLLMMALMLLLTATSVMAQQQRFPKPEFESGYEQPATETPAPRAEAMEYVDMLLLLVVLALASWFAVRSRSRQGILWLSVFTLIYFGFYRNGCICSVGSLQNVTLAFFDSAYAIPVTALLFFLLPLLFTLFFGRTFCAGACPLGAIQDLVIIKPLSLPQWLNRTLGLIPYLYLTLAVLFAATGTDFIICRYDPFVGIFRMDAPFHMVVLGASFLLMGMFIGRPYCRFFCPYGVLLGWVSRFSKWHLSITPAACIRCKLCANACPFDAIDFPTDPKVETKASGGPRRFITYAVLIPLWVAVGIIAGAGAHTWLSNAHPDVFLAGLLISHPEVKSDPDNIDVQTFLSSGKTMEVLVQEAEVIRKKFYTGSMIAGGFMGLVIGMTLLQTVVFRRRDDYLPNRDHCLSCGRCMDYCPVEKEKL